MLQTGQRVGAASSAHMVATAAIWAAPLATARRNRQCRHSLNTVHSLKHQGSRRCLLAQLPTVGTYVALGVHAHVSLAGTIVELISPPRPGERLSVESTDKTHFPRRPHLRDRSLVSCAVSTMAAASLYSAGRALTARCARSLRTEAVAARWQSSTRLTRSSSTLWPAAHPA